MPPQRLTRKDWWLAQLDRLSPIAYALVVLVAAVAFLVLGIMSVQNAHHIDAQAKRIDAESRARDRAVQQSRLEVCRATNDRHKQTIRTLHEQAQDAIDRTKDPVVKQQIKASIHSSILLINAIVPYQNCVKVVTPPPTGDR